MGTTCGRKTQYKSACFLCPSITCGILALFFLLSTLLVIGPLYREERDIYNNLKEIDITKDVSMAAAKPIEIKEIDRDEFDNPLIDFLTDVLTNDPAKPSIWTAIRDYEHSFEYRFWVELEINSNLTLRSTIPEHYQSHKHAETWVQDLAKQRNSAGDLDLLIDGKYAYLPSIRDDYKTVMEAMTFNYIMFGGISIILVAFELVWLAFGGCISYKLNQPESHKPGIKTGLLSVEEVSKGGDDAKYAETKIDEVDYVFQEDSSSVGGGSESGPGDFVSPALGEVAPPPVEEGPEDIPGMVGPSMMGPGGY